MLIVVLVYFGLSFLFILLLGYLQIPEPPPLAHDNPPETKYAAIYRNLALAALTMQGVVSVVVGMGTPLFPVAAAFLALTLLCHHAVVDRYSCSEDESWWWFPFQYKDVSNHDTWVVVSLVAGLVSYLRV
jgi:hypothetical protein